MSQPVVGRRYEEVDSTASYSLKLLLIIGSVWFVTILMVIVFALGTMI